MIYHLQASEKLNSKSKNLVHQDWQKYLNKQVAIELCTDDGIVALNKPQGVLSHPNIDRKAASNAIFLCPYSLTQEMYYTSDTPVAYLLNRLDSPVSGLILIGLSSEIAQAVKHAFREKTVVKKYLALLKGHLLKKQGVWQSSITTIKKNKTVRAAKYGNNIATTKFKVLREFSWQSTTLSFVELQPITGRTHQLRLHCAENLSPIVGDKIYGDFTFNKKFSQLTGQKSLFLHSNEIRIQFQLNGKNKTFLAKSGSGFEKFCTNLLIFKK